MNGYKRNTPAQTASISLSGLVGFSTTISVGPSQATAGLAIKGLSDTQTCETRIRVRTSLSQAGIDNGDMLNMPDCTLTIGAGTGYPGSQLDLPIAVAIGTYMGKIKRGKLTTTALFGELYLSGELRPVRGLLPMLEAARALGFKRAIVPHANAAEASNARGIEVLAAFTLRDVISCLNEEMDLYKAVDHERPTPMPDYGYDLSEIAGQWAEKRALEVAAAGHHNLLLIGPPIAGKIMLARRLTGIMPDMEEDEMREVTSIHSVAGFLDPAVGLLQKRPFRAPHHTVSEAGMVGGGKPPRPGEVSLAHHGVLCLDDLNEFSTRTLAATRAALNRGETVAMREKATSRFPARPLVIGMANGCGCGKSKCDCSPERIANYMQQLLHTVGDLFPIRCRVSPNQGTPGKAEASSDSKSARGRTTKAQERLRKRARRIEARPELLDKPLSKICEDVITSAKKNFGLSAESVAQLREIAQTICYLGGAKKIELPHVVEAIQLHTGC